MAALEAAASGGWRPLHSVNNVYFAGRTEDLLDVVGTNGREIRTDGVARAVGSYRQPDSHG